MAKRPLSVELAMKGQLVSVLQTVPSPDWSEAKCASPAVDPEVFFGEQLYEISTAKLICADCPIKDVCCDWASKNSAYGVWGGLTSREREIKFGFEPLPTHQDLSEEVRFILDSSIATVAVKFGVDQRTVIRWRNELRTVKEAM